MWIGLCFKAWPVNLFWTMEYWWAWHNQKFGKLLFNREWPHLLLRIFWPPCKQTCAYYSIKDWESSPPYLPSCTWWSKAFIFIKSYLSRYPIGDPGPVIKVLPVIIISVNTQLYLPTWLSLHFQWVGQFLQVPVFSPFAGSFKAGLHTMFPSSQCLHICY